MPGGIHPPLEVMLSWPAPNYVDPVTRPKASTILACVFAPITVFLLLARLWVRIRIQNNAGWDDWLMIAAAPFIVALSVLIPLVCDVYRFDRHVWDVNPRYFIIQRKYVMAIESIFCIAAGLIKISILLFYRRLSSRAISKPFRWATWLSIGYIAMYSTAFALIPIFGCRPISAFWDQLDATKVLKGYKFKCFNEGADVFAASVISSSQDLLTAMLPTFLYWNLKIPFRQKVALFGIFAIGYGVVALGALRSYYNWIIFFETYDVTWVAWNSWIWTLVELHVGAMCANAPALKVFFKQYLKLDKLTTRSKSVSDGSRRRGAGPLPRSGYGKFTFWKSAHSRSKNGYFSEPHTELSVDPHGGVKVQKEIRISHSPISKHSSTDRITGRYDDDVEMGSLETRAPSADSKSDYREEVQALPRISSHGPPQAPENATPLAPPPTAKNSLSPFPFKHKDGTQHWQHWS